MAKRAEQITYTYTDEAPMLATHAFYPIIKAFCSRASVPVELKDISVSGRVISHFTDYLTEEQKMDDHLGELGLLAQKGLANIIKLPNVSASIPQLKECIKELQSQGYKLPEYPENPKDDKEKEIKSRYAKVLGSAVNPVLREGNSDRRAAVPVKEYAFRYPHSMGKWAEDSKTHVACMRDGDFYSHEKSIVLSEACEARIELVADDGTVTVLKDKLSLQEGEVLDASFMSCKALCKFFEEQIQDAKAKDVLFSLHLKATMMKISDPIMFGHCVKVYFKDVFAKYNDTFVKLGVDANNGLGDVYKKIASLPEEERKAIEADLLATYEKRGKMAMVDSNRGITNLHVPSDIIIDNSMPTAIRAGGKMWNVHDKEEDFKATIPDRGYGLVFHEVVEFCKKNGAFDPKTMGCCPNVGLMAQKAEEYGSHPTTFEPKQNGIIRIVVNGSDRVLMGHRVSAGDIWRACFTKDAPIKDWVKLAVTRCRANNFPGNDKPCKAIFWLDACRTHDVNLMQKVKAYLPEFDASGLDIEIMSPVEAMRVTCQRAKEGLNTITVTGNVLRDYLTDLFPILELGTSAKMLSVVPMLAGGGMYETGAGGSAPKHVQQFQKEGHLRWDSLGEYLALTCSMEDLARDTGNEKAKFLAAALDKAVGRFLVANKNPSRKVKEIDNRGSHYWVARYWAEELSKQEDDAGLKEAFASFAKELSDSEAKILQDLIDCQGKPVDIGGYYHLDKAKADAAMNPSQTLNGIISRIQMAKRAEKITYTYTDEAPMLATHAFYPIIKAFCSQASVPVELKDISVSGRVISHFPDYLTEEQKMDDHLGELGLLAQKGLANIIKLPNVSASIPQLKECIKELQSQGYNLPEYPENPKDDKEKEIKSRYAKVLGSAVNPVLREGNSDRRAAVPVKEYAFRYPHSMGKWAEDSKTHVACMSDGDFYSHEKSIVLSEACEARIELVADDGTVTVLKDKLPLQAGEVLDASFMNCDALCKFFEEQIQDAKAKDVLFSLHLKATMMKISDPIMFGHCVKVYFKDVFAKYNDTFVKLGVDPNNGLGDVYKKIASLPEAERKAIEADLLATYEKRGKMAMVDSNRGITNLHVPSDIIIDNSMPTAIRAGGKMWNEDDKEEDFKATIPDRGYGLVFHEVVEFCKKNGAFDPKTMGCCPNVGLMAQKAEEYGSHPTTFEPKQSGILRIVVNGSERVLMGHRVSAGDIWRACLTKDAPIKDWVKLAVTRCRANNFPRNDKPCKAIFWLDACRSHDVNLMQKVKAYLPEFDTSGLDIEILSPVEAMRVTCQRAKEGLNTITVTGNVLRDYLTDLFPILELGTSAKMLSVVPMLAGGGMYETGAGGSAPKHVQQFQKEGHLRWDSLGEYLALTCSMEDLARDTSNGKAKALAAALDKAVGSFLVANKNPSRKVKEIDNRGSHYWVARYWAEELSKQEDDAGLKETFTSFAKELSDNEAKILQDLIDCQGKPMDIGGYYHLDKAKADAAMNPSPTLNGIISHIQK